MSKPIKSKALGQKFRDGYSLQWPFIIRASREYYAYCNVCKAEFSIKHGGKFDITRHTQTSKHVQISNAVMQNAAESKSLEQFVKITPEAQKVKEVECLMTNFLVEHNLPISVADHM